MFKIESYVTPILLSYVDKYVRDFKPADAQVSLWGGGVALHNLVLKADVLQREVALPFTLVSGRIHELLIQVPWTKIMSEPIVVTIDTIECVLSLNRPVATPTEEHVPESPRRKSPPIEAPPGYMQALVRRIVTNIALRVHHLIVKYVQDDIVLSLNVKHLAVDSAGADWLPAFADIDQAQPEIRRLVRLDDLTLCLDKADADGKIRFYQEPLLYRCQLDFRIVSKLQSAMTRRATGLSVQLRASRLAWGVTGDQLTMLLRLLTERALVPHAPPAPASNTTDAQTATNIGQSSSAAEPSRTESWSEWAWSWLPSTTDRDPGVASAPGASVTPLPLHFAAYFDDISLMFKIMESDSNNRKRSRGVLELSAKQTALKSYICKPTTMRIRFGTRTFTLTSQGKCICGHMGYHALLDEPTMYIQSRDRGPEEEWVWPDDELNAVEEVAQAVDEQFIPPPEPTNDSKAEQHVASQNFDSESERKLSEPPLAQKDDGNEFWNKMAPQVYVEYIHERSPPRPTTNPYDNPPDDFEYSDWVEECDVKVRLKPMTLRFSMGLLHRIEALNMILKEIPPLHLPDPPMRILTVEECEALTENLPQRRISIEIEGLLVRARPYDHVLFERPTVSPLVLDVELPNINLAVTGPLYPHRVCVAASQLPDDAGALWQGARLHVALHVEAAQALICSDTRSKARPCARASVHAVLHALLNKEYFIRRKSIELSFSVQISEASVCGSMSRLQAACQVASSLATKQYSAPLKCTSLAADALNDEESVAVDVTLEELLLRGYLTRSTTTYIVTLQATKATMLHEQKGSVLKQAWLFSAPDSHTNTHCLRLAVQYCKEPGGLEYAGAWTEPAAFAIDPLFLAWLAYRPTLKPLDTLASAGSMKSLSSSYFIRKRTTITHTSSSGRGGTKSGSGAEVHVRGRSQGSSDLADSIQRPEPKVKSPLERFWGSEVLLVLHKRLQRMLVNVELGLTLVYVTPTTASAIDCATVRDAMERHAAIAQDVLAINLGRLSMFSNTLTNQIWNEIKHDGPTYAVKSTKPQVHESFPWKLVLADMSIYTFEVRAGATSRSGREGSLKSQLRNLSVAKMRTVLENVSSTLTVSLVTKQKQITQIVKQKPPKKEKELTAIETRVKYFTGGIDFKPTTLKEFVRGPSKRKRKEAPKEEKTSGAPGEAEAVVTTPGPLLSLGIHLHGDTPPLIFRLEQDQVHLVAAAIHCLTHIQTLLQRRPLHIPKGTGLKSKSFVRSAAGLDELSSPSTTTSEDRSAELIPIFEAQSVKNLETSDVKTFLWCQWVVSRITVIATSNQSKLALNVDDIISSVDVQTHYNQYKIQVASASVKHYTRSGSDEWTAGVLGGRVLEAREPTGAKEDTHFLGVTITQASVANLPASWKEELHPKLLERKRSRDSMWEIYATLAPLEAVIQPTILNQIISLVVEMSPKSFCPLSKEKAIVKPIDWPFCYVTAGGLRLLLTVQDEQSNKTEDDTFMFVLGKITVNPHPDNPICRRPINTAGESGWMNNSGALDGQQFELLIKHIGIRCAQFHQLVTQESTEQDLTKGTASENPALKWTQNVVVPNITPILHSLDMACVLAPALYVNDTLSCGPAVELNLVSDFALEISVDQLVMAKKVLKIMAKAFEERRSRNRLQSDTQDNLCPYAVLLMSPVDSDNSCVYESNLLVEDVKRPSGSPHGADSGIDFDAASRSQLGENTPVVVSKSVSIAFVEHGPDASEYLEVFVTMGTIELSLYTTDDGSALMAALRPPNHWTNSVPADSPVQVILKEEVERNSSREKETSSSHSLAARSAKSLTETVRHADIGNTKLEMAYKYPSARKLEGNLPLLHVTLNQPNLYYWRKAGQKSIQVSLFDAWVGLGAGVSADCWYAALLSTERGAADPVTDIPPALATLNVAAPLGPVQSATVAPGSVTVDVERPVMLEVSSDRLLMLKGIYILIKDRMLPTREKVEKIPIKTFKMKAEEGPFLYKLRRLLVHESIESVTLQTTQIGVNGSQGAAGWDSLSVQVSAGGRPERLVGRCLVSAAVVSAGPPGDSRHVVLQPLMIGGECEARWEAWRRVEGGLCGKEPTARVCVDLDCVELDLRPLDWEALRAIRAALDEFTADLVTPKPSRTDVPDQGSEPVLVSKASMSTAETASEQHFYKDDLRSGAFKIVSGGQLPMAYQVTLHNNSVSWRYPHPRTITRLVAFPLPGQDEETPCVLELFSTMLCAWEAHTYFSVPVGEPRELQLYLPMPDAVSAQMWRFRVLESEQKPTPFEFNIHRYMPRSNPMTNEACEEPILPAPSCGVTAEQLSGVVRVDSCFSPRLSPRLRVATRVASLGVYLHNSLPSLSGVSTTFEGYYVSKPLLRQHRVLALCARSATLRAQLASPAGALLLLHGYLSSDLLECSTGAMEHLVEECQIRAGLSLPVGALSRARVALSHVNVALDIPRLRTLQSLHVDWKKVIMANMDMTKASDDNSLLSVEQTEVTQEELEGRVSLWIHNTCASALRVGQEGTEEVVPLGPGARLAYRWRSPTAPKKLRFALVGPSTDWSWSTGIPFTVDHYRVRLNDCEDVGSCKPASVGAAYLYTSVEERGSRLCMRLAGRLCLANMLRFHLLYKVRARCNESNQWRTVCSSELHAETVGRTVICGAICEMSVKIKFTTNDTGWSGDIPLKECPKENVPWLVKVPCEGDLAYMSVWTRVVRARTDGRIMATVWPLYVLYSHLSLDTDVLVVSESRPDAEAPPLVQAAPGRGRATQILAPGTTAARHRLSFQYRNIDCPVTKEAVPLHYGMTETSVFDKRSPATSLEDVYAETKQWLRRCGRFADSSWPYSIVSEHWRGQWKPALLQPKCDVTVQYAAVRAGGGCSLEVQLRPVVIICNAAPIALTLRAHDAAPLCKLEPGMAISPPTAVLTKAFFISVEVGRETFVSGELCVSQAELGAYGAPAPGRVALHVPMEMAIHCNHKVALLTMHYEIKEEINVLGLTSTYMLINRLDEDILMSALALPSDEEDESLLKPSTYKVIEPTEPNSVHGTCVSKFWVSGRLWRGSDPAELRLFLYLALPGAPEGARAAPVRLAQHPLRRPLALVDTQHNSVAVVVTQVRVEGRWVVTVARDPCPQLLVVNRTRSPVAVAAPRHAGDPATSTTVPQQECAGTSWHCVVLPDQALHYSTPSYCLRYPPHVDMTPPLPILFLTFARILEGSTVGEWCAPVAGTEGEQLVQLANDETVKLLVRAHPHSTRLELRDVDHRDISASDIRRRLIGAFSSEDMLGAIMPSKMDPTNLKRTHAVDKLPIPAVSGADVPNPPSSGRATPGRVSQSGSSPGGRTPNEQTPFDGPVLTDEDKQHHPSTSVLYSVTADSFDTDFEQTSKAALPTASLESMEASNVFHGVNDNEWEDTASWRTSERLRLLATSVGVQLSAQADVRPLLALFLDRAAVVVKSDSRRTKTTISIADVQVDNLQYESGQYDFPVVASTRGEPAPEVTWPPLWSLFGERAAFATRQDDARALLRLTHDSWSDGRAHYTEISEVELRVGPLAVYVEDAYVTALVSLARGAARAAASPGDTLLAEERALRAPLRLRMLHLHPLDLTLTLHTAVRMYIALDQSPLRLSAFKMADVMTSPERLTHALTVHYLSAAILGAGWVVGGLELLGAPGALAARVGGATGGVRGVASAAAAALLRSLSAWAGSLARNLDLLAGDVEHARRAAAARRRPPQSLMAGLTAGITNFAINILGAVGGLAHHPVVGVAVGESDSGATALRRGLIGALAKPLSATADLVAYAGQGLLTQTGWDPVPQPRSSWRAPAGEGGGWRRHCVRWTFRLADQPAVAAFHALVDGTPLHLLLTHKYLMLAEAESERVLEMIEFKQCSVEPYEGQIILLKVIQRRPSKVVFESRLHDEADEDTVQISAAAMARVARYAGVEGARAHSAAAPGERRALQLLPAPGQALALHALLRAAIHHNSDVFFPLL